MNPNLVTDYHPWTAVLYNGRRISRLTNPGTSFAAVLERLPDVHLFVIHLEQDLHAAVRLSDGFFYFGPDAFVSHSGWFPTASHPKSGKFELIYSRSCKATFGTGKPRASVQHYNLGWKNNKSGQTTLMVIRPDGRFTWSR